MRLDDGSTTTFSQIVANIISMINVSQSATFLINVNDPTAVLNMNGDTTEGIITVSEGGNLYFTGIGGATFVLSNANADGSGIVARQKSNILLSTQTAIQFSTTQVSPTKAVLVLLTGASASSFNTITDVTCTNLIICGNAATIPGPSYSTSFNDYTTVPPQNCFISFG